VSQDPRWNRGPVIGASRALPGEVEGGGEDTITWTQIRHYLHAPLRRPWLVMVPWLVVLGLSAAALLVIPKRYKSTTLILVESQKMPESFVPKVATEDRSQRLEAIRPEILSRTRIEKVLDETQPYPDIDSKTHAVEQMRRAIFINIQGNDGFNIEYVHQDPKKAQQVTDRLANLFIEETLRSREQQVEGAVDFLVTQVADARKEVEKKDEALRRYKETRLGSLPEQLQTNLATLSMTQQEMQTVEESLIFARAKRDALARRRPVTSTVTSPSGAVVPGTDELDDLRRQLTTLKGRYTEAHPDVQRLQARIARLESRLTAIAQPGEPEIVDDSALVREQLEAANLEVRKLEEKRIDLERRNALIRSRVEETPRTEQDLANLKRDYDKLNENYTTLLAKRLEAQLAGRLEQRWKGDRFRVLDPANLPEKPYFPKPHLIIGLGTVVGLLVGLGMALGAEYLDPSIKDVQDIEKMLNFPVLARISRLPEIGAVAR
jgi:polysaccharide chain length determinant protein (PEP-CTERM system associated)